MLLVHRCDLYKCQENCTIKDSLVQGYYPLHLEIDDLDLHPGDFKVIVGDPEDSHIVKWNIDDEFEDATNQTYFESIRYVFLVSTSILSFLSVQNLNLVAYITTTH